MKRLFLCVALVLVGDVLSGCYTTEGHFARIINEHVPVSEETRATFGVMGVLPVATAARFEFQHLAGVGEAAETISAASFDKMADSIRADEDASFGDRMGALAFSSVLSGAVGIVGGIFTGVPEGDLKRAEKEIQQALKDQPLEPGIGMHLRKIVNVTHRHDCVAISDSAVAGLKEADIAAGDFRALTNSGVDSVLLVRVAEQGFSTDGKLNPVMPVEISLRIQVVRVSDGKRLFGDVLCYRGERRHFTEWGANKAKLFRAELETAKITFADAIFDELAGEEMPPPRR